MGSSSSKPAVGPSDYVWKASSVDHQVAESLRHGTETDTTRAQALELAIQARLATELAKLSEKESAALKSAQMKASEIVEKEQSVGKTSQTVSKEVEALRLRLDKRKQLRELPDTVEKARGDVVKCLVENDRRPLDCWREVEAFKEEVRRLEKGWVEKVVR
ncbi:DUF1690-domain-containing protein [Xylariomycetidae sp. FL2044]|nr:DUF1690-domain-containing protein [Xylariomycetidae sp. FL2044]KAH9883661.1 DUF1690-domain-containing protein [Xylariomycetidae sp. FL2044]